MSTPPAQGGVTAPLAAITSSTRSEPESETSNEPAPARAAQMIGEVDKLEKHVDRKNLSADDSQRDILAQKLLQQAKEALAERDSVAAMSLANKASTLLAPLPKLPD